jgi:hypothetical protein
MWSRFRSGIVVCALFSCSFPFAAAQIARTELNGGRSPDGRLAIKLQSKPTKNAGAIVWYVVLDDKTGATLLRVKSSYSANSTDPDEIPERWLDLANSTDVYWNRESSLAAIDEYPLQHSGHVFLVAIDRNHHARSLRFPEREIIRRTGFVWERVRIRVCERGTAHWMDNHHLCLNVGGFPSRKTGEAASAGTFPNRVFRAVIEVDPSLRTRVVSVQPAPDS